jgi:membrane protein
LAAILRIEVLMSISSQRDREAGLGVARKARELGQRVLLAVVAAGERFVDAEAYRLSASLSFYTLSSIFPLMFVAIGLAKFVLGDSESLQTSLISTLDATHSPAVRSLIQDTLASIRESRQNDVWGVVLGSVAAVFGASGIFLELDAAMGKILLVKHPNDSFWRSIIKTLRERATALLLVIVTSVLLLCGTLVLATVEAIISHIPLVERAFPGAFTEGTALGFTVAALCLCYKILPGTPVRWIPALIGAGTAGSLLHAIRWPLTFFLSHTTNYSAYGVVGTLLLLLTWFYVTGCTLLFGASLTAVTNSDLTPTPRSLRGFGGPGDVLVSKNPR